MNARPPINALRAWRLALPRSDRTLIAAGRLLGISKVEMWRWETGRRRIPPEKVPAVEAMTGVPRELLRPDVYGAVSRARAPKLLAASSATIA